MTQLESSVSMDEVFEGNLRIRGTFIDMKPNETPLRSCSAPPAPGRHASAPNTQGDFQSRYMSSLTKRAKYLSQKSADASSSMQQMLLVSSERNQDRKPVSRIINKKWQSEGGSIIAKKSMRTPHKGSLSEGPFVAAHSISASAQKCGGTDSCHTAPAQSLLVPKESKRIILSGSSGASQRWLKENKRCSRKCEIAVATEITTMMICDIPCRRGLEHIIAAIDGVGFANTYNMVYVPSKRMGDGNMGYVFVNFTTPEAAAAFSQTFKNFSFPGSTSKKLSYAKPAHLQGYQANIDKYLNQDILGRLLLVEDAAHGEIYMA